MFPRKHAQLVGQDAILSYSVRQLIFLGCFAIVYQTNTLHLHHTKQRTTMKNLILRSAAMVFCILMISCQPRRDSQKPDELVAHIDSTVKPGSDFFLYANGKWFKENPIPPSEHSNGLWQLIQDTINAQIRTICESSAALTAAEKGSPKQKIGDFFFTGMDSIALNKKGISDLKSDFDMIDSDQGYKGRDERRLVHPYRVRIASLRLRRGTGRPGSAARTRSSSGRGA